MRTVMALIALTSLLGACANPVRDAEQSVADHLKHTETLEFRNLVQYPGPVVCGQYRAIQRFGETTRWQPFVYRSGEAEVSPQAGDVTVFCSEDPAASLQQQFSIRVDAESRGPLTQISADLRLLHETLERFYTDNMNYPSTARGLQALTAPASEQPSPRKAPAAGYLATEPQDPWGRPYHYEAPVFAGSKQPPTLLTLGADGKPGGEGLDADIAVELVPYLEHVLAL